MPEELENLEEEDNVEPVPQKETDSSVPNSHQKNNITNFPNKGPLGPNLANIKRGQGFNPNNMALKKGANAAAKKIPGVGLLAHTPMGKKIIDSAVDSVDQMANQTTETGEKKKSNGSPFPAMPGANPLKKAIGGILPGAAKAENVGGTVEMLIKVKKYAPIFGVISLFFGLIFLVVVVSVMMRTINPLLIINESLEKLGSAFTGCGFTTSEECLDIKQQQFYDEIRTVYNQYLDKYGVKLDKSLITASLTYVDIEAEMSDENFTIEDLDEQIDPGKYDELKRMIRILADKMAPIKKHEVTDEKGNTEIVKSRQLDLDAYKVYLQETFVPNFYLVSYFGENKALKSKQIVDEIYSRIEFFNDLINENKNYGNIYAYCKGVTVVDKNKNVIGTYDLDTYVAGVISGESYGGYPKSAYEAQAITARTFVLNLTNNCESTIENSDSNQVFDENIKDFAKEAADSTSGMVLTYEGQIFSAQYDSFCFEDSRCPDSRYDAATDSYVVEYTKLPDGTKHTISISASFSNKFTGQGHARGMSQLKSYEMAENGSTSEEILKYFYSNGVAISNMNAASDGDYGYIQVIDGVFNIPSGIPAGSEGTRGDGKIYNGGYNAVFESRLYNFVEAARKEGIIILVPISNGAYRTFNEQNYFWNCYQTKQCNNGNSASPPGKGLHGWGLASDLNYSANPGGRQKAVNWAHAHAAEFDLGFHVASEDWHIEPTEFVYK